MLLLIIFTVNQLGQTRDRSIESSLSIIRPQICHNH